MLQARRRLWEEFKTHVVNTKIVPDLMMQKITRYCLCHYEDNGGCIMGVYLCNVSKTNPVYRCCSRSYMGHFIGLFCRVILLDHFIGSFQWVISVGHFIRPFHRVISVGHFSGSFRWVISLGHFHRVNISGFRRYFKQLAILSGLQIVYKTQVVG